MTRNKEYYFTTTVYALVNLHSLNTEEWRRSVLQNKSDFFFGAECECLFCSVFTSIILSVGGAPAAAAASAAAAAPSAASAPSPESHHHRIHHHHHRVHVRVEAAAAAAAAPTALAHARDVSALGGDP